MKKCVILVMVFIILLTGCKSDERKCTVTLNEKSIENIVTEVEATEVKLNTPFTIGDLEMNVEEVRLVQEDSNQTGTSYWVMVEISALNNGEGSCKMSEAIQIVAFSTDLSTQYLNAYSDFEGLMGSGQRLLKDKYIQAGETVFGVVPFSIDEKSDTSNLRIYLLISDKLFVVDK